MILDSIRYSQHDGTVQQWKLEECTLGKINLIVGENASGKSKVLNIIGNLGDLLSGDRGLFLTANYDVKFKRDGQTISYILKCEREAIVEEKLDIDSDNLLTRGADGIGKIRYQKHGDTRDFQAPPNQVVSVTRRDTIQHPFLEDLYQWGKSVRRYYFGTDMGKPGVVLPQKAREGSVDQHLNPKQTDRVVGIFIEGQRMFSKRFNDSVRQDMAAIGYELTEIWAAPLTRILLQGAPGEATGLYVKEADLKGTTDQFEMSQGMFRALSLVIQITYSQFASAPSCILIDDIGEGLDYNRSTALVKLLVEKAEKSPVQLLMATNDRFVMNSVPLEYWSVMQRLGNVSRIHNNRNSPNLFKEFQLTGLNNFDFFSSKYYLKGNG